MCKHYAEKFAQAAADVIAMCDRIIPRLAALDADMAQMDKSSDRYRRAVELGEMVCGFVSQLHDHLMLCDFAWGICEEIKAEKDE